MVNVWLINKNMLFKNISMALITKVIAKLPKIFEKKSSSGKSQ